eukprot:scaffold1307_cov166-Ochromonas_danica.AAC.32
MQMHVQPKYYDKMTRGKSVGQLAPGAAAFIQNTGSANQRMKPKNANGGGGDGHGAHGKNIGSRELGNAIHNDHDYANKDRGHLVVVLSINSLDERVFHCMSIERGN